MHPALSMLLGLGAGVLSGLFGIGGGIVIVPLLMLLGGYSQQTAAGTSLVALLLPVGLGGVLSGYHAGVIGPRHVRVGLLIALGLTVGSALGARLALHLPEMLMRRLFAGLLMGLAIRVFWGTVAGGGR